MLRRVLTVALIVGLGAVAGARQAQTPPAPASAPASSLEAVLNAMTMRNIGAFRTAAWISAIDVPESPGARPPLHDLRREPERRPVEDDERRHDLDATSPTASTSKRPARSRSRRRIRRSSGSAAAIRPTRAVRSPARACSSPPTPATTWQLMGLPDSHHIARIVIHPKNPDIVYVAALGHLFSKNEERGVFRTMDGGKTWKKVLYIDDGVGAVDLVINRKTPTQLFASMYDKERLPWQIVESGPKSGIYRTDDARREVDAADGRPADRQDRPHRHRHLSEEPADSVRAAREPESTRSAGASPGSRRTAGRRWQSRRLRSRKASSATSSTAPTTAARRGRRRRRRTSPAARRRTRSIRSRSIRTTTRSCSPPATTCTSRATAARPGRRQVSCAACSVTSARCGGTRTTSSASSSASDGGVSVSVDGGRTGDYFPNMRVGEVYAIGVDMDDPYNVYGGLQDHDSWKGPSNGKMGRITLEDWVTVGPGDGMYNVVDPTDSRWVYNTRELNSMGRLDQKTGIRTNIAPTRPAASRVCATTGSRRSRCRRSIRASSTPARRCCSDRWTAAITGKRSARI